MKVIPLTTVVLSFMLASATRAAAPIELEVATERGLQITAPREWLQLFTSLGVDNVRIRGAVAGDKPAVENRGNEGRPRYYVLGLLTARDQLRLPGGTFGRGDRAKLKDYFDRLVADGADRLTAARGRYGLTEQELAAVFADLTQSINFETKGQPPRAVLDLLQSKFAQEFSLDAEADAALRKASGVADELKGITAGTATAMMLRSYGLIFRPEKQRGQPVLFRITAASSAESSQSTLGKESDENPQQWPIGWEPDEIPGNLAPSLFAQLNAEIDGYSLAEALAAIGPRMKAPLYLDHRALAARQIDPAAIQVKLPPTRTTYMRVLSRVLSQARLGASLRVDEAGRPFVWITR